MKDNNRKSASEINKFVYCNYQWYYSKTYGDKKLKDLYKNRNKKTNKKTNVKNTNNSSKNFQKGLEFHNNYLEKNKKLNALEITKIVIFIIVMFVILYFLSI